MGEWSYIRANSSSRISICVTATFSALRYRWVTRTMPAASACCSGGRFPATEISFSRMLPLFSIIMGNALLLSSCAYDNTKVCPPYEQIPFFFILYTTEDEKCKRAVVQFARNI